jgi:hypothetical protein
MSSLITVSPVSPRIGFPQVIDAKGDKRDCQPALLSRKMTAPAEGVL